MKLKVLAFLQNAWFRHPDRARRIFERHPGERRRFLSVYLFAGCLTGRRLRAAFKAAFDDEDVCYDIVWEEVSPEIGGHASSVFPPDPDHIRRALQEEAPDVVLAFGRIAAGALPSLWTGPLLVGPHPAARGADVVPALREVAEALRALEESAACPLKPDPVGT